MLNDKSLSSHFIKPTIKVKWTKREILLEAKKYKTRKEWRLKSPASYSRAKDKKFKLTSIKELSDHFAPTKRKTKWTKKKGIRFFAKNFERVGDWKKRITFPINLQEDMDIVQRQQKHMNTNWK